MAKVLTGITHKEMRYWHALYTKSRAEKKVAEHLQNDGFQAYLPLVKTVRQWSDRKKKVEVPLISSYVFVYVDAWECYNILGRPGVVCYVKFEGKPARIPDSAIEAMRLAVDGNMPMELQTEIPKPGQKVRIVSGPMKGSVGEYLETRHKYNFIIDLSTVGFSLRVEVKAQDVVKV